MVPSEIVLPLKDVFCRDLYSICLREHSTACPVLMMMPLYKPCHSFISTFISNSESGAAATQLAYNLSNSDVHFMAELRGSSRVKNGQAEEQEGQVWRMVKKIDVYIKLITFYVTQNT